MIVIIEYLRDHPIKRMIFTILTTYGFGWVGGSEWCIHASNWLTPPPPTQVVINERSLRIWGVGGWCPGNPYGVRIVKIVCFIGR